MEYHTLGGLKCINLLSSSDVGWTYMIKVWEGWAVMWKPVSQLWMSAGSWWWFLGLQSLTTFVTSS